MLNFLLSVGIFTLVINMGLPLWVGAYSEIFPPVLLMHKHCLRNDVVISVLGHSSVCERLACGFYGRLISKQFFKKIADRNLIRVFNIILVSLQKSTAQSVNIFVSFSSHLYPSTFSCFVCVCLIM